MARRRFYVYNGAQAALTAAPASVSTGTAIKTMLQIKPTSNIAMVDWGFDCDTVPTAHIAWELLTTGTVAATVTAYATGDVCKFDDAGSVASAISLGTTASGYTSSSEGTITASRLLDIGPGWAASYTKQFPLDREGGIQTNDILRIRCTTASAVNVRCWITFEE